jgi:hypothetical protein
MKGADFISSANAAGIVVPAAQLETDNCAQLVTRLQECFFEFSNFVVFLLADGSRGTFDLKNTTRQKLIGL